MGNTQDPQTARELADLSARMVAVERDAKEIKQDLRAIRDAILEARGGWKTLAVLSSISAGAGALAAKVATVLGMLPK